MRAFMQFTRNKGATDSKPALGSDAAPNTGTGPVPNADNVCRIPSNSSWSGGLKRLALTLVGASNLNVEIWIKETLTQTWFLAQASMTLTAGAVTFSTNIPAPTNIPVRDAASGDMLKDDFTEVYIRLIDPGGAGNGDYTCAVIGDYVN